DRYQTAREMDADLARVAQGLPVAHETEEAATAVLSGAGLEAATEVVPAAARGQAAGHVPPRYRRYYDYEEGTPRRPIWPWLRAAILLMAAGGAGYFVYRQIEHRLSSSANVQVPFVQGITEGLEIGHIKKAGHTYKLVRRPNE